MREWALLSKSYFGWSLKDIQKLTPRERINWLELAKEDGKVSKA